MATVEGLRRRAMTHKTLKMRALLLKEYGGVDQLELVENHPAPTIADDQILVAVTAASINPIDYKIRSGATAARFPQTFPVILGRDVSGVVRAVGAAVTTFKPGDRVAALAQRTFAELVAVPAADAALVPDGMDLVEAAAYPLVCLTADQLVRIATKARAGQTVLVTGALGAVGRAAVYTVQQLGARAIAVVRASRVAEAAALHADGVLSLDDHAALDALGPVDAIADTLGSVTTKLLPYVRAGGVVGTVVTPPPDVAAYPQLELNRLAAKPDAAATRGFLEAVVLGRFRLPIEPPIPLSRVGEGQERLERGGGVGKIVVRIGDG